MITPARSAPSALAPALLLCAQACASDPPPETTPAPESHVQLALADPGPADPQLAEQLDPAPETTPESPPAVSNDPPSLHLAYDGRCKDLAVSQVDDEVFVHFRPRMDPVEVHRVGRDKPSIERHVFSDIHELKHEDGDPIEYEAREFTGVYGRYPDQLYFVVDFSFRDYHATRLYRFEGGDWKEFTLLGARTDYHRAWPWHDNSVLAFATTVKQDQSFREIQRLVVVRGAGKGPKLNRLVRGCDSYTEHVALLDVEPTGLVTAVTTCKGTKITTWAVGDREGTTVKLSSKSAESVTGALGSDGRGALLVRYKRGAELLAWDGATVEPIAPPTGTKRLGWIGRDRDGSLWAVHKNTLYHRGGDGAWATEALPEGVAISTLAGFEHGTPWIAGSDRDDPIVARTPDGTWHVVALPETEVVSGTVPKVLDIHVAGPGDAFVSTTYWRMSKKKKNRGREMRAMFSTRPFADPVRCEPRHK